MSDHKDLQNHEGIEKLKKIAMDVDICMFCTNVSGIPFDTRPMSTQDVDDQGNLWFMSKKNMTTGYNCFMPTRKAQTT